MTLTLIIAIVGAVTGTTGTVLSLLTRRDAARARHARALRARDTVVAIRETLAEAKAEPSKAGQLTGSQTFRAHLGEVEDETKRCPDRKIRKKLGDVSTRCLSLSNSAATAGSSVPFSVTSGIDSALDAVSDVLDRLDTLDRQAPN